MPEGSENEFGKNFMNFPQTLAFPLTCGYNGC